MPKRPSNKGRAGRPAKSDYHLARHASKIDAQVGNRIRLRRMAAGTTQQTLATKLKLSFQQVQKYEKGVNRVSARAIIELCQALGCDPNYLLGWTHADTVDDTLPTMAIRLAVRFAALDPEMQPRISKLIDAMAERRDCD